MHPCDDCVTYGVVVWLNDEELAKLDVFEGTPTVYEKQKINVELATDLW